jgi:hypothetical protein
MHVKNKGIISVVKTLEINSLSSLYKQVKQIIKKDRQNTLLIRIKSHLLPEKEISLFKKTEDDIFIYENRYLYLKVLLSSPAQLCFWWYVGDKKYITKPFDLSVGYTIYEFDLLTMRAFDLWIFKNKYLLNEKINEFGIKSLSYCKIEWAKFSRYKLTFGKEFNNIFSVGS